MTWLLIGMAIAVIASFEFAFRISRSTKKMERTLEAPDKSDYASVYFTDKNCSSEWIESGGGKHWADKGDAN